MNPNMIGHKHMNPFKKFLKKYKVSMKGSLQHSLTELMHTKRKPGFNIVEEPESPNYKPKLGEVYSDGSHGLNTRQEEVCSGAYLTHTHAGKCRVNGIKMHSYRAEAAAVFCAAEKSTPDSTIYCDNQGLVKVLTSTAPVLESADIILPTRAMMSQKQLQIQWIKGHNGHPGNEEADRLAGLARELRKPGPWAPAKIDEFSFQGVQVTHPKHFTNSSIPRHKHTDIHPTNWKILRQLRASEAKYKWTQGCKNYPGFKFHSEGWYLETKEGKAKKWEQCSLCNNEHPLTVQRCIQMCEHSAYEEFRNSLFKYFGDHSSVSSKFNRSTPNQQYVFCRLLLPTQWLDDTTTTTRRMLWKGIKQLWADTGMLHKRILSLPTPCPREEDLFHAKPDPWSWEGMRRT